MSATFNEQTKLLATAINNVAVAFVILGVVTPLTAVSFGVASAPAPSPWTAFFALVWFCAGGQPTSSGETCAAEPEAMNAGEIFVTFVIPAVVLAVAYAAVLANERAARRHDSPPGE